MATTLRGYAKADATEGGGKVYSTVNNPPSELLRLNEVELKTAGVLTGAAFYMDRPGYVVSYRTRLNTVSSWSATDLVVALQMRKGTTASGSGTNIGSVTITQSGAAVGDEDEDTSISAIPFAKGDVIEVETTTGGTATSVLGSVVIGVVYDLKAA